MSGVKQGGYQCDRLRPRLESQDVWGVDFGYYFELVVQPKRGKQCMTYSLVNQVDIWTEFELRVLIRMVSLSVRDLLYLPADQLHLVDRVPLIGNKLW